MTDQPQHPAIGLVLDCLDPSRLAEFWAPALGYVSLGDVGAYAVLVPNGRAGLKLLLQSVPETKAVKNRMHLDIETPDIEAEAARLEALGARRLRADQVHEHGTSWVLMADPEGNEFCVCDGGAAHKEPMQRHEAVREATAVSVEREARGISAPTPRW